MSESQRYVLGVDVGTGSVRAGLFDLTGKRLSLAVEAIEMWHPQPDWAEQSSNDIWGAVGATVQKALRAAGVDASQVVGIGYDATCSLVVLDKANGPLAVSDSGDPERNVIVWMDHRAIAETESINNGGYDVLKNVGGKLSPEMETPKLRWLKRHMPATWEAAGKFLDLADFLVYQSTGQDIRSLCTCVCKWTYLGDESRWDKAYFDAIGIGDVFDGRVGEDVRPQGALAEPLTPESAKFLGLTTKTRVGVGIIDAHAGGLGLLGAVWQDTEGTPTEALETSLALIGGTSSCHMAVSREPRFIPGVWGPYYGAMVPGLWLTEGGQSATGALIDSVLNNHAASQQLVQVALHQGVSPYEAINAEITLLAAQSGLPYSSFLTRDLHVLDYHLGNRSPIADPRARGLIDGLTLDNSLASLARLYLATIQSVAYGTRAIIDALNAYGYHIESIYVVGGGTKNPVWLQEHADVTGATLYLPEEPESVLLGSALLGAVAAGEYPDILTAMKAMSRTSHAVTPRPETKSYHDAKYICYLELYGQQLARRARMVAESLAFKNTSSAAAIS